MTTILVVEDELSIAEMIQLFLEDKGYEVLLARHAHEALRYMREAQPDLVLSDIMMPGGDGLMLCRAMRAEPVYQSIPLVFMSARTSPILTEDCGFWPSCPNPSSQPPSLI